MTGIVDLILVEHERVLCLHAILACAKRGGRAEDMARTWRRLADLAQTTLLAEEEVCYPALFGATVEGEVRRTEAIAAHRHICRAITAARLQPVGSPLWWCAVKEALSGCFELFDAEERLLLGDFQRSASPALQEALGRQWVTFVTARHRYLSQQSRSALQPCSSAVLDAGMAPPPKRRPWPGISSGKALATGRGALTVPAPRTGGSPGKIARP